MTCTQESKKKNYLGWKKKILKISTSFRFRRYFLSTRTAARQVEPPYGARHRCLRLKRALRRLSCPVRFRLERQCSTEGRRRSLSCASRYFSPCSSPLSRENQNHHHTNNKRTAKSKYCRLSGCPVCCAAVAYTEIGWFFELL